MDLAAGHGLTVANLGEVVKALPKLQELNIGHALVCDAVLSGLADAVRLFRAVIDAAQQDGAAQ